MCKEKQKGCEKPDQLKGKPEECSAEQIQKCHGDTSEHPCTDVDCTVDECRACDERTECEDSKVGTCENPDKLKGEPGGCSPEQIRECHGGSGSHPCECN